MGLDVEVTGKIKLDKDYKKKGVELLIQFLDDSDTEELARSIIVPKAPNWFKELNDDEVELGVSFVGEFKDWERFNEEWLTPFAELAKQLNPEVYSLEVRTEGRNYGLAQDFYQWDRIIDEQTGDIKWFYEEDLGENSIANRRKESN